MAFEYNESTKYQLALRFKTVEDASYWVYNADAVDVSGEHRRHAEDWVDMCIESEDYLNKYLKLAVEWETVEYFAVYKH